MKVQVVVTESTYLKEKDDQSLRFQATFVGRGYLATEFGETEEEVLQKVKTHFINTEWDMTRIKVVDLEVGG